ncbi:hypothetical protein GGS23DRAFT_386720 [Durotheca rogersii]|uniref:uncharacterized protein n=1 Tax=Durotheca rogersii TaxID=419775 RepID=UPI00221E40E6|nr:uncharacterized protein GGS23DRAFT_386720 [Durotheca rogersii]KAI5857310.1 hypothetical protein GGS23DRAFT_386720 [Durotheca rogersii]
MGTQLHPLRDCLVRTYLLTSLGPGDRQEGGVAGVLPFHSDHSLLSAHHLPRPPSSPPLPSFLPPSSIAIPLSVSLYRRLPSHLPGLPHTHIDAPQYVLRIVPFHAPDVPERQVPWPFAARQISWLLLLLRRTASVRHNTRSRGWLDCPRWGSTSLTPRVGHPQGFWTPNDCRDRWPPDQPRDLSSSSAGGSVATSDLVYVPTQPGRGRLSSQVRVFGLYPSPFTLLHRAVCFFVCSCWSLPHPRTSLLPGPRRFVWGRPYASRVSGRIDYHHELRPFARSDRTAASQYDKAGRRLGA